MKWIKVTTRLPEPGVKVAVFHFRPQVTSGILITISSIQQEIVTTADHKLVGIKSWEGEINPRITHWAALPELQKGM